MADWGLREWAAAAGTLVAILSGLGAILLRAGRLLEKVSNVEKNLDEMKLSLASMSESLHALQERSARGSDVAGLKQHMDSELSTVRGEMANRVQIEEIKGDLAQHASKQQIEELNRKLSERVTSLKSDMAGLQSRIDQILLHLTAGKSEAAGTGQ